MDIYRVVYVEQEFLQPRTLGYWSSELEAICAAAVKRRELSDARDILGLWQVRPKSIQVNSWSVEKLIYHWYWEPVDARHEYMPRMALYVEQIPVHTPEPLVTSDFWESVQ